MIYESPYNEGFSYPAVDIPELILDHNLQGSAPDAPAIIDGYTGKVVYTYANLRHSISIFGGFLQQTLAIDKGDVIAYLSLNTVGATPCRR